MPDVVLTEAWVALAAILCWSREHLKQLPRDTRLIILVKTLIAEAAREDAQQAGVQPVRLQLP